ncbi:hypothetical protein GY45DRAFT_1273530 [Cubamyces sp. BRFM 1775]|nr:hypothetical protein GY45DRAFT_1273530 [Cubamyces sp. BRFM 1775]
MVAPTGENQISFSFFVELVQAIAAIKPHKATEKQPRNSRHSDSPAFKTFKRWIAALRERYSPLPPGTTAVVFRFLFPEEDTRRKYGMQETRLAQHISKILGVSSSTHARGERLRNWKGEDALGCLGNEVETVMATSSTVVSSDVSLARVDALLGELAAKSAFSDGTVRKPPPTTRRSREAILTDLYTVLTPVECAVVTQIILKDLQPLLYPIPKTASHYASALLQYKSNAVTMLTKTAAMYAWDPSGRMAVIFIARANVEEAANAFESFTNGEGMPEVTAGMPIQIPKCVKGQGPAHSLKALKGADKVWLETKYDGERAQIHVWFDENGAPRIRIFSKSGRDSTLDRAGIHSVIYDALGLTGIADEHHTAEPSFRQSIVVEAEMVAFSEVLGRIDEFWRIRSLIASTAIGVRHKTPPALSSTQQEVMGTQCSLISNASDGGNRRLALVFFDILLLDGVSLLSLSYAERRVILEQVITVKAGHAMLAERTCIDMRHANAEETLSRAFARVIADHQEGVVIKADGARYAERRWPWVKLKQDYIPGHGDTVDLVLLGASWEKDRARELRVPPTAYTTFYFGALTNADELKTHPTRPPHFEIIFTSSYGLDREQLEELNFMIKSSDPVTYRQHVTSGLSYIFELCPSLAPPVVLLRHPLLAELFGAGFTKAPGNLVYELRFPRIAKIFRPSDRLWSDGTTLSELMHIARAAVGRDRPGKAEDDWARSMFRPDEPPSPGVRCPVKRKRTEDMWVERLAEVDGKVSPRSPTKKARAQAGGASAVVGKGKKVAREEDDVENATSTASHDDSRPRTGLMRFGSVTNVVSSPVAYFGGPILSSPSPLSSHRDKEVCDSGQLNNVVAPGPSHPPHPSLPSFAPLPLPPISRTLTQLPSSASDKMACKSEPATPLPKSLNPSRALTSPKTPILCPPPSTALTIHQYLQDAAVWVARAPGARRPIWRAASHAVIPTGSQVSMLDALLIACGWDDTPPCNWATRGVVFVDDTDEHGQATLNRVIKELADARATMLRERGVRRAKSISVMSMRLLAHDRLAETATAEEFEREAICRFG